MTNLLLMPPGLLLLGSWRRRVPGANDELAEAAFGHRETIFYGYGIVPRDSGLETRGRWHCVASKPGGSAHLHSSQRLPQGPE